MHKEVKIGIVIGVLLMSLVAIFLMARPGTETSGDELGNAAVDGSLGSPGDPGAPVGLSGQLSDIGALDSLGDVTSGDTTTEGAQATEGAGTAPVARPPAAARKHKVAEGDTLTSIARKYYSSAKKADIARIYNANRQVIRDPDVLVVDMVLVIPDRSAAPNLPAVVIRSPVLTTGRGVTHVVRTGDTLTRLARKYYSSETKADVDRIFNANRNVIRDRDVLVVSSRLVIPPKP